MYYNSLIIDDKPCPADCHLCEEACSRAHGGNPAAIHRTETSVQICNQCSDPACAKACRLGALTYEEGVVRLDEEKCVGCGLCVKACEYAGIYMDKARKKAVKCDLCAECGSDPACAKACPHGILEYRKPGNVTSQLGEDLLPHGLPFCAGCLVELFARVTLKYFGDQAIVFGSPSCCILTGKSNLANYGALMTGGSASMTGVSRYYRHIGKEAVCLGLFGDGATADIAFQGLSAAAERGEHFIYFCYDNEAYMNTGIQQSSTTPLGSWTTTSQIGVAGRGKKTESKNMALIMAMHNIPYAATANMAYMEDFLAKLAKAKEAMKHGLVYIHVLTPCPTGWKSDTANAMKLSRLATQTGYFPLWEAEYGKFRFTHEESENRPLAEYIKLNGRFNHLKAEDVQAMQQQVDERYVYLKKLTTL